MADLFPMEQLLSCVLPEISVEILLIDIKELQKLPQEELEKGSHFGTILTPIGALLFIET